MSGLPEGRGWEVLALQAVPSGELAAQRSEFLSDKRVKAGERERGGTLKPLFAWAGPIRGDARVVRFGFNKGGLGASSGFRALAATL
jgi:hypothetical protein